MAPVEELAPEQKDSVCLGVGLTADTFSDFTTSPPFLGDPKSVSEPHTCPPCAHLNVDEGALYNDGSIGMRRQHEACAGLYPQYGAGDYVRVLYLHDEGTLSFR